jgi:hypothetical protein
MLTRNIPSVQGLTAVIRNKMRANLNGPVDRGADARSVYKVLSPTETNTIFNFFWQPPADAFGHIKTAAHRL